MGISSNRLYEIPPCKNKASSIPSQANTTYISYYLAPDLKEEDGDLSPYNYIFSLNQIRDQIIKFIPKLQNSDFLNMQEVAEEKPLYTYRPKLIEVGYYNIAFNISSTTCGQGFAIIESIYFSKWYFATNNTLFLYENQQLINNSQPNNTISALNNTNSSNNNSYNAFQFLPILRRGRANRFSRKTIGSPFLLQHNFGQAFPDELPIIKRLNLQQHNDEQHSRRYRLSIRLLHGQLHRSDAQHGVQHIPHARERPPGARSCTKRLCGSAERENTSPH